MTGNLPAGAVAFYLDADVTASSGGLDVPGGASVTIDVDGCDVPYASWRSGAPSVGPNTSLAPLASNGRDLELTGSVDASNGDLVTVKVSGVNIDTRLLIHRSRVALGYQETVRATAASKAGLARTTAIKFTVDTKH